MMSNRLSFLVGSDQGTKGQTMSVIELSWTARNEIESESSRFLTESEGSLGPVALFSATGVFCLKMDLAD